MVFPKNGHSWIVRRRICAALFVVSASAAVALFTGCASTEYSPMQAPELPKQWFGGVSAAYSANSVGGTFHSQSASAPDCNGFTGGSGSGAAIGISGNYLFRGDPKSSGVGVRITYQQMPGSFSAEYGPVTYFNNITGTPEQVAEQNLADVTYNVLDIRMMYDYAIPGSLAGVEIGPSIGIVSGMTIRQHLQIDQSVSPNVSFANGENDTTLSNGSPASQSGIRFGLWAGAHYKFNVGWGEIMPYVGYDLGLTKTLSTDSWSVSTLLIGVDILYGIH